MKKTCFVLIIALLITLLHANLAVNSYVDKTTLGASDILRFTIELSGEDASDAKQPELPEINGFSNLGASTSSSSSFVIANGKMSSTVTKTYTFSLQPTSSGNFLIPPITIKGKNNSVTTSPIKITVIEGTTNPPPVSQQYKGATQESESVDENLFIVAELSKSNAWKGEPIFVTYKLYSRYDIANLSFVSEPNFTGFWKDDVFTANKMAFQRTEYKNRLFSMMPLRTVVLYPNQSGQLTVPPLEVSIDLIVRARNFWDFDSTKRINVKSNSRAVSVKELPEAGRPESFTGAIGTYQISSKMTETDLKVNDTFTYQLTISGAGNLKHFDPPKFPELPFLRPIDPEVDTNTRHENDRTVGTKTVRYPLLVSEDGDYSLPSLSFSYFDPLSGSYKTLQTQPYKIQVAPSQYAPIFQGVAQKDVLSEGTDIYYIYETANLKGNGLKLNYPLYWLIVIITLLTIPLSLYYRNEKDKLQSDTTYRRQKLAHKLLNKYLKDASSSISSANGEFYSLASAGLSKYLTDILKIPRGSTTMNIMSTMKEFGYPEDLINRLENLMNRFLEARFRPDSLTKDVIDKDYEEVKELISLVNRNKNRKNKR